MSGAAVPLMVSDTSPSMVGSGKLGALRVLSDNLLPDRIARDPGATFMGRIGFSLIHVAPLG